MKKISVCILVVLCLMFAGCTQTAVISQEPEEQKEQIDIWSVEFHFLSTEKFILADEEQYFFNDLISKEWESGGDAVECDIIFENENGEKLKYSSLNGQLGYYEEFMKDGAVNVSYKSIKLSENERLALNDTISAYGKIGMPEDKISLLVNGEDIQLAAIGGCGLSWEDFDDGGDFVEWDGPGPQESLEIILEEKELADSGQYEEGLYVDMLSEVSSSDDLQLELSRGATCRQISIFDENCEKISTLKNFEEIFELAPGKYYVGLDIYSTGRYIAEEKTNEWSLSTYFFTFTVE